MKCKVHELLLPWALHKQPLGTGQIANSKIVEGQNSLCCCQLWLNWLYYFCTEKQRVLRVNVLVFHLKNLKYFYSYPKETTSFMVRPLTEDGEVCHMQKSSLLTVTKNIPRPFCSMCANEGLKISMPTAQHMTFDAFVMTVGPFLFLEIPQSLTFFNIYL